MISTRDDHSAEASARDEMPEIECRGDGVAERYCAAREETEFLAAPLSAEDQTIQSMPDASPTKWHRAHTTWFFETVILRLFSPRYEVFDASYAYLFNSYYESLGARHPRPQRGLITRPTVAEVTQYRGHVDRAMTDLIENTALGSDPKISALIELGIHHEQQHQELLLTDILHAFAQNARHPAYCSYSPALVRTSEPMHFVDIEGGEVEIGHAGDGFAFDNERPRHCVFLEPYRIADRPVTNAEWIEFIDAGGYENPLLWLSDGWAARRAEGWNAPLYWTKKGDAWHAMTLSGSRPVDPHAPVAHVSYYEADAYARWRGKRLPSEAEWEHAQSVAGGMSGNLGGSRYYRPLAAQDESATLKQMIGDVWEWTASAYAPYPGFEPLSGAVAEYNGKFMINQMVLKGGSCVTPEGHIRPSYRNFFYPHQRWQFSGVRLAEDIRPRERAATEDEDAAFLRSVVDGLSSLPKRLAAKYFYDAEGSRLFDAICELPAYYPTRTEITLLTKIAPEFAKRVVPGSVLLEFGAGSETKAEILLDACENFAAYAPIDISAAHLRNLAERVRKKYRRLSVFPIAGDFTRPLALQQSVRERPLVGFFPGSTIGNFEPRDAVRLLAVCKKILGDNNRLLLGIDLAKDTETLLAAYNDEAGITAAFNKNILAHINRKFDANIDLTGFRHNAIWNPEKSRIEMHLISNCAQSFAVGEKFFSMDAGETIHTENSHKYTVETISELAAESGWAVEDVWQSENPSFAVLLLR
jgi:dimethylhistidine N-methyltransferase